LFKETKSQPFAYLKEWSGLGIDNNYIGHCLIHGGKLAAVKSWNYGAFNFHPGKEICLCCTTNQTGQNSYLFQLEYDQACSLL